MIEFKPPKMEYRELWKPIEDTNEMYFVSDRGNVYSKHRNKILSPGISKGYAHVTVSKKSQQVHRLVMMTFKPIENSNEMQVNHIDLDTTNNCISNLEWCSPRENVIHYIKNGDANRKGGCNPNAKLTEKLVKEIRKTYNPDEHTLKYFANMYNVTSFTIREVLMNKSWYDESYVPTYKIRRYNKDRKGTANNSSKLTENDVIEIRETFEDNPNIRLTDISKKYGVAQTTISHIIYRKRWAHL